LLTRSEISLIIDKVPCYSATSVEVRAGNEEIVEQNINAYVALNDDEFVQYSVSLLQNVELVGRIAVNALIKANYFYSQESVNKIIKCSLV